MLFNPFYKFGFIEEPPSTNLIAWYSFLSEEPILSFQFLLLSIFINHNQPQLFTYTINVNILCLIVHYVTYRGVIKDYENVARSTLPVEFRKEYDNNPKGLKLRIFKNDLKKECLN